MKIQLSEHFTYKKLLRFTLPSIVMMVFSSIYGVVDGLFVSNFAGTDKFTTVNLIMPFLMILGTVGFMFGAGGSALIAKTLGEGDKGKANRLFSLFVYTSIIIGAVIAVLGIVFLAPVSRLLGAKGVMLDDCVTYGTYILIALPAFILQMEFQTFFVTAENPNLGLAFTVASGVTNIVLDALFVGVFGWGIIGAAVATGLSQAVGGFGPLFYFFSKNSSLLHLSKTNFDGKALLKACGNGSSELMANVSMSLVGMLYNIQLLKYAGEDGVAAYGVLMYVTMLFLAIFIGYSVGTAPIVGYHYGAQNHDELKGLLKKSLRIILLSSVAMCILAELLATPLSLVFVSKKAELLKMTKDAFRIYSFSFLFAGLAIYGSSFFTALNNGLVSAIISFLRTLVFQVAAVLILPLVMNGVDGIWLSIVVAELMAAVLTAIFLVANKKKYQY
ncbi:MAG: MATE family efflux transporter [Clostridia bacterium]|nr:MATE family efflux transporter [Clostridia bacterium]